MNSLHYKNKCKGLCVDKYNIQYTAVDKYCKQNKIKHKGLEKVDDPVVERMTYAYFVAKK